MKKYLCAVPLIVLFCFTIACQDKTAMAELETYKAQAAIEQQNMALVTKVFDELNKKNAGVYQETVCSGLRLALPFEQSEGPYPGRGSGILQDALGRIPRYA